jgi:hypothetical protein
MVKDINSSDSVIGGKNLILVGKKKVPIYHIVSMYPVRVNALTNRNSFTSFFKKRDPISNEQLCMIKRIVEIIYCNS